MSPTPSPPNGLYRVFRVRYKVGLPDPDMPQPRFHNSVFVETNVRTGEGIIHHVVGDITSNNGMTYNHKRAKNPRNSDSFVDLALLGQVSKANYPGRFNQILAALPTPPKQKHFNPKTHRTEPMKPGGGFYAPGEPRAPMWKCTEWTERHAIPALQQSGVLINGSARG